MTRHPAEQFFRRFYDLPLPILSEIPSLQHHHSIGRDSNGPCSGFRRATPLRWGYLLLRRLRDLGENLPYLSLDLRLRDLASFDVVWYQVFHPW
ncbi:MAG: hypothetical protein DDT27_00209 [Dehalococcoidia bacterium]|nr:hypothetical protein [Chloroflexota bacterium]